MQEVTLPLTGDGARAALWGKMSAPTRKITPGGEGATLLVIGGTPGKAYEPKT